eukprot:4443774-Pleurochrysis_carterae.AAC.1
MAEKVANAVRRLSDSLSTLLDVKLSLNAGVGNLALTIGAARSRGRTRERSTRKARRSEAPAP